MTEDVEVTFEEFVAAEGLSPRNVCKVCALPQGVKDELAKFYEAKYRGAPMRRYLVAVGYSDISGATLNNHMVRGHAW